MTITATRKASDVSNEIAPGVWRLGDELINFYALEEDGRVTIVDAGVPGFGDTLDSDLAAIGFEPSDVDAVVLTHADSDHTGVVPLLQAAGARVLVHSDAEEMLRDPGPKTGDASPARLLRQLWRPSLWRTLIHMGRRGAMNPPHVEGAETYGDGDVLDVPGRPRAIATPGHSPGHSALLVEDRGVLFAGDALCTLNPMTLKRGPQLMPSGFNVSDIEAETSLTRVAELDAQTVLVGHGEPWTEGAAAAVEHARAALR
jgi:glyoxylase-like metal-dependent hydrolase (beta-lactamase superfamily II)